MTDFEPEGRLYIDGEFREAAAGGRFEVRSPSDESVVGTAADAKAEDVAAAVGAARRAADETSWGTDHVFRQRVLRQLQAPLVVDRLLDAVRQAARERGVAVLLVEQHVAEVFRYADRVYVMRRGRVEISGEPRELADRLSDVEDSHLGRTGPGGPGQ